MSGLNFHVRHEVTPDRAWDVLVVIAEGQDYSHVIQSDRQLGRLRQLGLVENEEQTPTALGLALFQIGSRKREVVFELFHYLHYTLWDKTTPLENTASWSYMLYCNLLYERQECVLDLAFKEQIATEVDSLIRDSEIFGPYVEERTRKGAVSISPNTFNGIQHWLAMLTPPVIEMDLFSLRYFCPPELLLMALSYIAQQSSLDIGSELLLTSEKRDAICRLCLINPQALDRSLDWMLPLYPLIVQPGTRTGSYGRSVRLLRMPTIEDLVS